MKTIDEVSTLMSDQKLEEAGAAFFSLLKSNPTELSGKFAVGDLPHVHVLNIDGVGYVKVRFVDTVKYIFDAKGRKLFDRASLLSYVDITVKTEDSKAERRAYLARQVTKTAPAGQAETHAKNVANLTAIGSAAGIDLSGQDSWYRSYNEGYNK